MKIAAIAFTAKGMALGERLQQQLAEDELSLIRCPEGGLAAWVECNFGKVKALLFIGAAGIAVRAIAAHVRGKASDPAVLVLDENGAYVIPLLSGHLGGANELARYIAQTLSALPVITTATDVNGVWAVDDWARKQGLFIDNPQSIKWISARLLAGEAIPAKSLFPLADDLPAGLIIDENEYDILFTWRNRGRKQALRLIPPVVTLGVGCKKGVSAATLAEAYQMTLAKAGCHEAAVCQVCSIDMKAQETGLLEFCAGRGLPLVCFNAAQLAALPGSYTGSEFVQKITGVDNVCERASIAGSNGVLLSSKNAGNGVAMALAIKPYTVSFKEDI